MALYIDHTLWLQKAIPQSNLISLSFFHFLIIFFDWLSLNSSLIFDVFFFFASFSSLLKIQSTIDEAIAAGIFFEMLKPRVI